MKGYRHVALGPMMVLAAATVGACTQEARTDLARSAFVKTVNLKCKRRMRRSPRGHPTVFFS